MYEAIHTTWVYYMMNTPELSTWFWFRSLSSIYRSYSHL